MAENTNQNNRPNTNSETTKREEYNTYIPPRPKKDTRKPK
jgi:hypothetical protein